MGSVIPNAKEVTVDGEQQLEARLAELLHIMHRKHLSVQETQVS